MSEEKKPTKKKRGNYDEKLKIKGSFLDVIKASVKHADKNSKKKKD